MIEHKIIVANDKAIKLLEKDNRELCTIYNDKMYFKRTLKQTREIKKINEFPEWIEFIKLYREINNKGSYSETLIKKYKDTLKEISHNDMILKLSEYKQHLEAYTKPPLQVGTFLNQKRYLDTYETVKVNYEHKWRDDILKERNINGFTAESIIQEASAWDYKNKDKEMTSGIFDNIILKYIKK